MISPLLLRRATRELSRFLGDGTGRGGACAKDLQNQQDEVPLGDDGLLIKRVYINFKDRTVRYEYPRQNDLSYLLRQVPEGSYTFEI